nr:GNAT family N-acetyltransferase [uncultured Cellulosilyticum sp.]
MKAYVIREIIGEEIEESAKVIRESFRTVADDFNFTYENNPMHGAFLKKERLENERQQGIELYGMFVENKQVGFVALEKLRDGAYEMQKLSVLPAFRHLGYGEALVDFIKQTVIEKGGKRIVIGTIANNNILRKWYEKLDFKMEEIRSFKHIPFEVGIMGCFIK